MGHGICSPSPDAMPATDTISAPLRDALARFTSAYEKRDLAACLACFADTGPLVAFGTGVDEKRVGLAEIKAQFERDWSQSDEAAVDITWTSASVVGSFAWVAADCRLRFRAAGEAGLLPGRASFVLEDRAGTWLIRHLHISVPLGGQEAGKSF